MKFLKIFKNIFTDKTQGDCFCILFELFLVDLLTFLVHFCKEIFSFPQKQPSFPWKLRDIHRKTPVLESLFNKVTGLQCNFIKMRPQQRCFPVDIAKFFRAPILWMATYVFNLLSHYYYLFFWQYIFSKYKFRRKTSFSFSSVFFVFNVSLLPDLNPGNRA